MSTVTPLKNTQPANGIAAAPFHIEYAHTSAEAVLAQADEYLLALVSFDAAGGQQPSDPRHIEVALEQVAGPPTVEVWRSHLPVETGNEDGIAFARNSEVLVGQLVLNEDDYASIDAAAFDAYRRILAFQRHQGYKYALRMWNFFPDINAGEADEERYRQFSVGRARTLEQHAHFERALPAASAIGSYRSGLLVYFVAAREPGVQIENPRQISAFKYPRRYGPKSPSFSRAKLKTWQGEAQLFISGTASVVGHETFHQDDVLEQTTEIGRNIEALLDEAATKQPAFAAVRPQDLSLLRVYLRPPYDLEKIRARVEAWSGNEVPTIYLVGDVCRDDLLVEVEGFHQLAI